MAIKVKAQRDYLKTDVSIDLPADVSEVDGLLRATKTNGKMVVLYNGGAIQGISFEQNTKIPESKTMEVRSMIGVEDRKV